MRAILSSLLALLVLTQFARADFGIPAMRPVWQEAHVVFVDPPPDWTFFVVCNSFVRRVPVTPDGVSLTRLTEGSEYFRNRIGVTLCAVPNDVLSEAGLDVPTDKWFYENREHPRIRRATIGPGESFEGTRRFRVTLSETIWEVEKVPNDGAPWVAIVALFLSCALVLFGVHFIRRLFRRKSVTRTAPPPGITPEANLDQASGGT